MPQPAPLVAVLTLQIKSDLSKLRSVKRATENYNVTLERLAAVVVQDISPLAAAVAAIPTPTLSLAMLTSWLQSPLMPLVLAADPHASRDTFANMDARLQQAHLARVTARYAQYLTDQYRETLEGLQSWSVLRIAKSYLLEMQRLDYTPDDYQYSLRVVAQMRGLVGLDPTLSAVTNDFPFTDFVAESAGFTYTETLPASFSQEVLVFMNHLATAESKLADWRALAKPVD